MKRKNWVVLGIWLIIIILLFIIPSISHIFGIAGYYGLFQPTKIEVENFFEGNYLINPYITETNNDNEYFSAYYLRRHTTLSFGQIFSVPKFTLLFIYTPFHYFNYINPTSFETHTYLFINTKDEGTLVYNPINGRFVGSYNELMSKMGCKVQPNEDLWLANENCLIEIQQKQLDSLIKREEIIKNLTEEERKQFAEAGERTYYIEQGLKIYLNERNITLISESQLYNLMENLTLEQEEYLLNLGKEKGISIEDAMLEDLIKGSAL